MEVNVNNKLMKPRPFRWTSAELYKTVFSSEEETDKVLILSELDHKSHT